MLTRLLASAALVAVVTAPALAQETVFPATLVGHAILPANTMIAPPADAPASLAISGKYTRGDRSRVTDLGTVPGMDGLRPTGLALPFQGQPVQGFSGIAAAGDGTYWSLSDNGFGNKLNSVDTMLMLHHLGFDWEAGTVDRMATIFLSDPNFVVPFPIVNEASAERYLTGGDFDVESIQPVADGFWIGEEFGPYLIKVDLEGVVTAVIPTMVGETVVRSPDHPALNLPANPTVALPAFNLKRSGGYEGLALSTDGAHLYGLLEGPLYVDGAVETVGEAPALRIVELDVSTQAWTGFADIFTMPDGPGGMPMMSHLRFTKYADILLRPAMVPATGPKGLGFTLTFTVFDGTLDAIDALAERARRAGATIVQEPGNRPWNARDFTVADPDGFRLTFTKGPVRTDLSFAEVIDRAGKPGA